MLDNILQAIIDFFNPPETDVSGAPADILVQGFIIILAVLLAKLAQLILVALFRPVKRRIPDFPFRTELFAIGGGVLFPVLSKFFVDGSEIFLAGVSKSTFLINAAGRAATIWIVYALVAALVNLNSSPKMADFWIRKVLLPLAVIVGLINALGLLDEILNWGIYIESINWSLTVGSVLLAIAVILIFISLARWVSRALANSFLPEAGLEPDLVLTISKIATYLVVVVGVLVALGTVGIDLTAFTVILGGLSVGLAFGLQEIVNNFVSGFIVLLERSIVPTDVIEIKDNVGVVQKVGIRSSVIKTRDNIELIIPNSYFLTEIVTNMTHAEALVRTRVSVGVSYNARPREVEQALLAVAESHPDVLADPPPTVQFREFGDSSLNFQLFVWTNQAIQTPMLTSDLRYLIWDALAERNIEIPFPQRDLHIRSGVPWEQGAGSEGAGE